MKYLLIFLNIITFFNSKTLIEQSIEILFREYNDQYIGNEDGVFALKSEFKDINNIFSDSDIEQTTNFRMELLGAVFKYPLNCRLWKGEEKYINLICNMEIELKEQELISINENHTIQYNDYNVIIMLNIKYCQLYKVEGNIPFLYSPPQEINLTESQKTINLKFKIESYNGEHLILQSSHNRDYKYSNYVHLDNCRVKNNILNCELSKENLDVIALKENKFYLRYFTEIAPSKGFKFVSLIYINYSNSSKQNIYLSLDKLVYKEIEDEYLVTFLTNVTQLPKLKTLIFFINF